MDRNSRRRMLSLGVIGLAVLGLLTLTAVGARSLPGTTRSLALSWTVDVIQVIQIGIGLVIVLHFARHPILTGTSHRGARS